MLAQLKQYLLVFLVAMAPIVELRGAIPIGVGMGLDMVPTYIVAIIGNILPVPFLILFSKRVLTWLAGNRRSAPFFQKIIARADNKAKNTGKAGLLGLFLFVAIPIPGTGAWMGSLIAAILQLRVVPAFFAISGGVCTAGVLMMLASQGLLGIFSSLF